MIACAAFRALRMVPGRHRRWRLWSAARRRWLIKERDRRRASAAGQERLATGPPRRAVHARHSDALDEPDGASASPGSAHRRQQERSGSPFSASGLVPSGPGSPAAGSARPGYRPALAASERQNARIWAAPITAPRIRIGRQIGGSRARGLIAACCPARIDPERAGRQDRRKGNQGSHRHE